LCGAFAEHEVTGAVLLTLSESDLEVQLGITKFGQRRQISMAIEELRGGAGSSFQGAPKGRPAISSGAAGQADRGMLRPRGVAEASTPPRQPGNVPPRTFSSGGEARWSDGGKGKGKDRGKDSGSDNGNRYNGKGHDGAGRWAERKDWRGGEDRGNGDWREKDDRSRGSWRSHPY